MLKKLTALVATCLFATTFMACDDETLDPKDSRSISRYFSKMKPPIQMSEDQFVSFVKSDRSRIEQDTANMSLFLVVNPDYLNKPNTKGNAAISVAVNKQNPVVVKYLLDRGAKMNEKSGQIGMTPLEDAATRADTVGIFDMLIEAQKKADPNLQNIGMALHLAARYGALKNVQTLIENGADANAKSNEGLTPLHESAKEGKQPVVEYLISKKVEINPTDRDGYTPVDWACAMGEGSTFPEIGKILKKAGAKHTAAWRAAQ